MPTFTVYDRLANIALAEFADIVLNATILSLSTGDPHKLRLDIVDQSFLDVWLSGSGRYSFHWERRHTSKGDMYRFDNAPHYRWQVVFSFPHHFHRGDETTVVESDIPPEPEQAIQKVLAFVRQTLLAEAGRSIR